MGQRYASFDTTRMDPVDADLSYETRELAWELSQARIDSTRVRYLIETGGALPAALTVAHLKAEDVLKNPHLRHLQLQRHLDAAVAL